MGNPESNYPSPITDLEHRICILPIDTSAASIQPPFPDLGLTADQIEPGRPYLED
jgi:hypothetical protein